MMDNLKLIEYEPCYAKAVSDMWIKSSKGWNGEFGNTTEESVLKEMESSTSINTYLAERQGEILGYCDFAQFIQDEGALYISLLNVRYDCHGKGIGKALVSKAIERTVELGWPRLDLYTWPGNKKSIPLYKKCGFFLENSGQTHLMNFIPYVLETEAVKDIFRSIHWYKDMKRTIDMEPEGRKENGFEFYEYLWEKDGSSLRMEFERNGRGLRLIETDDYKIAAKLERQDLVFGQNYNICYEVVNKSGKPLQIEIRGIDNKNIKFNFHEVKSVNDTEKIYGEFYVGEIAGEVNPLKTYPAVQAEVLINGKKAVFKLGIEPKCPAEIDLAGIKALPYHCDSECYKDVISETYLNIENSFDQEVTFSFSLKDNSDIEFLDKEFNISMKPKEKKSFKLKYMLKNYFFYSENIPVTAELKDGKKIGFIKRITCAFKGREGGFGGESEDYYIIVNGSFSVKKSKLNNKVYIREYEEEDAKTFFDVPKVGMPYTSEFYNIKPKKVAWYRDGDWMVLESTCVSQRHKNIEVTTVFRLLANGITEHYIKVFNNSENESTEDINLLQSCNHYMMSNGALPMDGRVIEITNNEFEQLSCFDISKLTENWLFCSTQKMSRGFCWSKKIKPRMADWFMGFEYNLGKMPSKGSFVTEPVKLAMNTFKNWRDFRNFATGSSSSDDIESAEDLEISINKGNPFVKDKFNIQIIEHKEQLLQGEFRLSSGKGSIMDSVKAVKAEDKCNETSIDALRNKDVNMDILNVEIDLPLTCSEKKTAIFPVKDTVLSEEIIDDQGCSIYSADNGLINIKASADFSPSLISMAYKGHEWLENSFPKPSAKSWFNPWVGGIFGSIEEFDLRAILKEKIEADFTGLYDNYKNLWKGIKTRVKAENNEKYAGLEINNYYLMLPGVPVLCHTVEIIQNTGKLMNKENFESVSFFGIDKDIKNNYMIFRNRKGEYVKYKSGRESAEIYADGSIFIGSKNFDDKLQLFTRFEKARPMPFLNTNDTACFINGKITAADGGKVFTTPAFYIFTDEIIEDKILKDLRNIHF